MILMQGWFIVDDNKILHRALRPDPAVARCRYAFVSHPITAQPNEIRDMVIEHYQKYGIAFVENKVDKDIKSGNIDSNTKE